jgi:hypothetical protein
LKAEDLLVHLPNPSQSGLFFVTGDEIDDTIEVLSGFGRPNDFHD